MFKFSKNNNELKHFLDKYFNVDLKIDNMIDVRKFLLSFSSDIVTLKVKHASFSSLHELSHDLNTLFVFNDSGHEISFELTGLRKNFFSTYFSDLNRFMSQAHLQASHVKNFDTEKKELFSYYVYSIFKEDKSFFMDNFYGHITLSDLLYMEFNSFLKNSLFSNISYEKSIIYNGLIKDITLEDFQYFDREFFEQSLSFLLEYTKESFLSDIAVYYKYDSISINDSIHLYKDSLIVHSFETLGDLFDFLSSSEEKALDSEFKYVLILSTVQENFKDFFDSFNKYIISKVY